MPLTQQQIEEIAKVLPEAIRIPLSVTEPSAVARVAMLQTLNAMASVVSLDQPAETKEKGPELSAPAQ